MTTQLRERAEPRKLLLVVLALLALVSVSLFEGRTATAADGAVSATSANVFSPNTVTIYAGDKVNFTRTGGTHTATAASDSSVQFNLTLSSTVLTGSTPVFTTPGTYYFYCNPHSEFRTSADIAANFNSGEMYGKIVVAAAPVADTTAPSVSGVAASPNPTNGAGAIALSATVTDTAPTGATPAVAAAEWSKGANAAAAGSGTAMTGSFGSASAAVSASVAITEPVGSSVTLWVRGRDAAGNWSGAVSTTVTVSAVPAGAVQASVTVTGGGLSNTAQSVAFPGVTLTGSDQTVVGSTAAWQAQDARGTGAGWNVTITSTDFLGSAGSINVSNFKVRLTAVTTIAGNTPPTPTPASYVSLSSSPLKLLSAATSAGMGTYQYTPNFQLTVPGGALAGSYTANVSVSVNSGP